MKKNIPYYLGLDIGTDSIGYAVTDEAYKLLRFKGKSMWGSGLFDSATPCQDRRAKRTARRRLDRRQQRVRLLREFFAKAIAAVDPKFFVRLRESALFADDRTDSLDNQTLFNDPAFKDADFHAKYPTVHHLIVDLMNDATPHDPRLVYIACQWLVAHRGHFLSEVSLENVSVLDDMTELYEEMMGCFSGGAETEDGETREVGPLWTCDVKAFGEILAKRMNLTRKREMLFELIWGEKTKWPKQTEVAYNVISLLCGSNSVKPANLFGKKEEYKDYSPLCLSADEEKLESQIGELGDDGDAVRKLKALYDWAILRDVRKGGGSISEAKVAVYEQHRKDLAGLKAFLKAHDQKLYYKVFRMDDEKTANYTAYVHNGKSAKNAKKSDFSEWLAKELKGVTPTAPEKAFYDDMMNRLAMQLFLPKQIDGDNRVIPHQLYQVELRAVLKNASAYLEFLNEKDEYGTVAEKIDSIFGFRVPYFVGPLVGHDEDRGKFAWMVRRKEGLIRPWNFKEIVDLDKSEDEFINRMTNFCTYVPGEDVLPAESLVYREYEVLNEINPLKIQGAPITPDVKKRILDELFGRKRKVTRPALVKFLQQENLMRAGDELSGVDEAIKSSLASYHDFRHWLDKGVLSREEVEKIILRSTCTEDTRRLSEWILRQGFGVRLDASDVRKISRLKYSEFGRLSRRFLTGIEFEKKETGERGTVMDFLKRENVVLMQLLSEEYTLGEELAKIAAEYYATHEMTLEKRLDEMYVSSAVKRQIYRALDIVKTVKKVMGHAPQKIFVEMARGGLLEQKGKRTKSRHEQLLDLYRGVKDVEVKAVNAELEKMGDGADNRLQADALFLWNLQLGHCAYCGKPLPVENLKTMANIDHIYPQSKVKDDSVLNNKVLCCSTCNDAKKDAYPVPQGLRQEALWTRWRKLELMTEEKYRRLMRCEKFSESELQNFINRQLVETRQTTKAVFTILREIIPETETVAVKAGNVSDFRHELDLLKCRAVNDLHHAKDAYLNIVVGNVYHERFSRQYFRLTDGYTMKVGKLFGEGSHIENARGVAWDGSRSLARVKATMARNDVHLTKYAFYAKGELFKLPKKRGEISLKKGMSLEYGGYVKPKAKGFLLVGYKAENKAELAIVPVNIVDQHIVDATDDLLCQYVKKILQSSGKISELTFPIGKRMLKVNVMLELDGFPYVIAGKTGDSLVVRSLRAYAPGKSEHDYIKRIESLNEKMRKNPRLVVDETYDKISVQKNLLLYKKLSETLLSPGFLNMPSSQAGRIRKGYEAFERLDIKEQVKTLLQIINLVKTNRAGECDLKAIGGAGQAGKLTIRSKLSNWKKVYKEARIVYSDFSGMFVKKSENLLDLL